jgi:hypothetical protein
MRHIGYLFSLLLFSILVSACKVDPTGIPGGTKVSFMRSLCAVITTVLGMVSAI